MSKQSLQNSIRENVLEKIKTGEIRKLPRAYFVLRIIATLFVGVLLLAGSALVASFIFFSLHESGEQFLLGFGLQGVAIFLKLFPWLFLAFDLLLVFLLEWLLQGFSFGYRIPLLNIFVSIVLASVVLGGVISLTPLHQELLHLSDKHELPIFAPAYEHIFDSHDDDGVCRGIVASVATSTFELTHTDMDHDASTAESTFTVPIPSDISPSMLKVGQRVLVLGSSPDQHDTTDFDTHPSSFPCASAEHIQILQPITP